VIPHTVTTIVRRWAKILMSSKVRNITRTRNKRPTIDGAKAQRLPLQELLWLEITTVSSLKDGPIGFRPSHH
jgi:hypothetical protein